ncbi:MAG: hypothetical protein J5940_03875 [Clostridia bacterium]|nr:hypothetical protein [Clostridia bacterium]
MSKKKLLLICLSAVLVLLAAIPLFASGDGPQTRTVMLYAIGSNLESSWGLATWNLKQSMEAEYDENLNYIVITGGSTEWHTEAEYLEGAESVDPDFRQVWKVEGKREDEEHGKMILLEEKGIEGFEENNLSDNELLTAFIDYCYTNYPADQFDLILWDHGGGPNWGYGHDSLTDDHFYLYELMESFGNTELIKSGRKFEIIDFDACLMGNVEVVAALGPYADYLVISPEIEPGDGQEYTSWLNAVKEHPEMNGFELGRIIVDGLIKYYGDDYPTATLSVVSVKNFNERLADKIARLDGILTSEAKNAGRLNNRYNYYDELYSLENAFGYSGGDSSLYDLGNLVGALSCPQSEVNNITEAQTAESVNVYTELALEILEILRDNDNSGDDVLYAGASACMNKAITAGYTRNAEGEIIWSSEDEQVSVYPTGLSIIFGDFTGYTSGDFVKQMTLAAEKAATEESRAFLLRRAVTTAYYGLIVHSGQITSYAANRGYRYVSFRSVKERTNPTYWDSYIQPLIDFLVGQGEFKDADELWDFMSCITAQQSMEVISKDKVSVRRIINAEGSSDSYRFVVTNTSAQAFMNVYGRNRISCSAVDSEDFKDFVKLIYGNADINELYPNGLCFDAHKFEGVLDFSDYILSLDDTNEAIYQRLYASPSSVWTVEEAVTDCYVIYDRTGKPHLADIRFLDSSKTSALIPAAAYAVEDGEIYPERIYLYAALEGNVWKIKGYTYDSEDAADRLMALRTFSDAEFRLTTAASVTDAKYDYTTLLPISSFFDVDGFEENWGLTIGTCKLTELEDAKSWEPKYFISDVYGYSIDITECFEEADKKAEKGDVIYDLACAYITAEPVVYNGQAQKPELTIVINGKRLVYGTDYKALYYPSVLPGYGYVYLMGIGDYSGAFYASYIIYCAEHTFETVYEKAASCTEDGYIERYCEVCGYITGEVLPATGHSLIHVDAKLPTVKEEGHIEYWICGTCGVCFADAEGTNEISLADTVRRIEEYRHDPKENPKAMEDIVEDEYAVYGFRPSGTGSLKEYADYDWSDPLLIEEWRQERIAYHESIGTMYDMLFKMKTAGYSTAEIARALSTRRNEIRLEAYENDPEGLAAVKARNLEKYGHEEGPLPDELYAKYGSWETVIIKAFSPHVGMDVCLGLYDDYYAFYVILGLAEPYSYNVVSGDGAIIENIVDTLTFVTDAYSDKLVSVELDGGTVPPAYYTVGDDGVTITLTDLIWFPPQPGYHKLTIRYTEGIATASFEVKIAYPLINGVEDGIVIPAVFMVISGCALIALISCRKRKRI